MTDPQILQQYGLAHTWEKTSSGAYRNSGDVQKSVAPEVLFLERCVDWLRPGGRAAIVVPDGILGNPGDEYIRAWLMRKCWILASVDLPVEVFVAEANVNILTSLLFVKRKPDHVIQAEDLDQPSPYPIFMAVAEKVGFDRRGVPLYCRNERGEEVLVQETETERIRVNGDFVVRALNRSKKVLDDDLPRIADEYREFRLKNSEPGS